MVPRLLRGLPLAGNAPALGVRAGGPAPGGTPSRGPQTTHARLDCCLYSPLSIVCCTLPDCGPTPTSPTLAGPGVHIPCCPLPMLRPLLSGGSPRPWPLIPTSSWGLRPTPLAFPYSMARYHAHHASMFCTVHTTRLTSTNPSACCRTPSSHCDLGLPLTGLDRDSPVSIFRSSLLAGPMSEGPALALEFTLPAAFFPRRSRLLVSLPDPVLCLLCHLEASATHLRLSPALLLTLRVPSLNPAAHPRAPRRMHPLHNYAPPPAACAPVGDRPPGDAPPILRQCCHGLHLRCLSMCFSAAGPMQPAIPCALHLPSQLGHLPYIPVGPVLTLRPPSFVVCALGWIATTAFFFDLWHSLS